MSDSKSILREATGTARGPEGASTQTMERPASQEARQGSLPEDVSQPPIHTDEVAAIEGSPIAVTPETQPTRRSRFGPLRHRFFRNVWIGSIVSNTGGWMESVGVQWVVSH